MYRHPTTDTPFGQVDYSTDGSTIASFSFVRLEVPRCNPARGRLYFYREPGLWRVDTSAVYQADRLDSEMSRAQAARFRSVVARWLRERFVDAEVGFIQGRNLAAKKRLEDARAELNARRARVATALRELADAQEALRASDLESPAWAAYERAYLDDVASAYSAERVEHVVHAWDAAVEELGASEAVDRFWRFQDRIPAVQRTDVDPRGGSRDDQARW